MSEVEERARAHDALHELFEENAQFQQEQIRNGIRPPGFIDEFEARVAEAQSRIDRAERELSLCRISNPPPVAGIADDFLFDDDFPRDERDLIRKAHEVAYERALACSNITDDEKRRVIDVYETRTVRHSLTDEDDVFARARINGSRIWVNTRLLLAAGERETAQTMLHEMMHLAGYSHPERRDEGADRDVPGDNGPYYGTPPLRSEFCIAGIQSIRHCVAKDDGCRILAGGLFDGPVVKPGPHL